jgi:hypothetical protein
LKRRLRGNELHEEKKKTQQLSKLANYRDTTINVIASRNNKDGIDGFEKT